MISPVTSINSLLLAIAILLLGSGLLGTLLGLRVAIEGYSNSVAGLVMSGFFFGYIFGTFIVFRLIHQVGHIRTFAALAALASAAVILHGLIIDPLVWWLLRVVTGICMVGMYMVVESWLNEQAHHTRRGRVFAMYMTVNLLALAVSQFLILLYGPENLASFALVAMFMCLALVPIALTPVTAPIPTSVPDINLRKLYSISPLGTVGALITGLGNGAFWAMGPVFAQNIGLSPVSIAAFMAMVIFAGALLQWPIGHQSDRRDRRLVLMVVSFAGSASIFLAYFFSSYSDLGLIIMATLYGGFSFSVYSLSVAHTNDHMAPSETLASTRGLLMINGIGATIGPVFAGILMQFLGPRSFLIYLGLTLMLLGLFTAYRMKIRAAVPREEQSAFVPMARTSIAAAELDPRADLEQELDLTPEPE